MKDGIIKIAAGVPRITLGDTARNADEIITLIERADKLGVKVLVLPELCVTGYTMGDLFLLDSLIMGAEEAIDRIAEATEGRDMLVVFGAPVMQCGKLYSTAVFAQHGNVIGIVPKSNVSDNRMFSAFDGENIIDDKLNCPFGTKLIFRCDCGLSVAGEIGADLWAPYSPSGNHALNGALLICHPSADVEIAGKADYNRSLVSVQSAKLCCAYVTANAGDGESTTDSVYAGRSMVAENGIILAESEPYSVGLTVADIDINHLMHDRKRNDVFNRANSEKYKTVSFSLKTKQTEFTRKPIENPFVPAALNERNKRAEEILRIQTAGLAGRMSNCHIEKCVIGVSGGLDSTLALLVACRTADVLKLPRIAITAVTMPCFGTTRRTRSNAEKMCAVLGVDFLTVDITESVKLHLRDIGHDGKTPDVTYENAQARERTQVLFDIANKLGGLVVGTGDLSELALGWCTYNGDHMSAYGVNASVPKTLIRHLVAYEAERLPELRGVLLDVVATPVSPELLPTDSDNIVQPTEEIVGPYELHDFFVYHLVRWGSSQEKIQRLASAAFDGVYSAGEINKWLTLFLKRFYTSAFKRSCMPDGAKVGSVSLSPRDRRVPSDSTIVK